MVLNCPSAAGSNGLSYCCVTALEAEAGEEEDASAEEEEADIEVEELALEEAEAESVEAVGDGAADSWPSDILLMYTACGVW
jgi:hypothetical protein